MQYFVFYSLSGNPIKCSLGIISEVRSVPIPPSSSPDTNWVSCDSIQSWYYLPKDSFRFHRLSFSPTKTAFPPSRWPQSVLSPDCYLCIWLTGYNEGFPPLAPWTSDASCKFRLFFTCTSDWLTIKQRFPRSLLGLFCSLQNSEALYSPDYLFIMTGYNWQTAKWKRCLGQGMEKDHRVPMLPLDTPLSSNFHMFSNLEVFHTLSFRVLWRLHYIVVIG